MSAELEEKLIYSVIVAGKSAAFTDAVMDRLAAHRQKYSCFEFVRILIEEGNLEWVLRDIRSGNYGKLAKCLRELIASDIDLASCTPRDLEKIHGIGPKTSRFFILWTRPGAEYAALDVHVLRWLRNAGHDAPRATPTGKKYSALEAIFLAHAKARGMTPRELDHEIWINGSGYVGEVQAQP